MVDDTWWASSDHEFCNGTREVVWSGEDDLGNLNPPILHRKEEFIPRHHPRWGEFFELTRAEEREGLFADTKTIGFKLNWERLLASKGLQIEGHQLRQIDGEWNETVDGTPEGSPESSRWSESAQTTGSWPQYNPSSLEGCQKLYDGAVELQRPEAGPKIERHRTALRRHELSK